MSSLFFLFYLSDPLLFATEVVIYGVYVFYRPICLFVCILFTYFSLIESVRNDHANWTMRRWYIFGIQTRYIFSNAAGMLWNGPVNILRRVLPLNIERWPKNLRTIKPKFRFTNDLIYAVCVKLWMPLEIAPEIAALFLKCIGMQTENFERPAQNTGNIWIWLSFSYTYTLTFL